LVSGQFDAEFLVTRLAPVLAQFPSLGRQLKDSNLKAIRNIREKAFKQHFAHTLTKLTSDVCP
jgi:hypothetical protein